MGGDYSFMPSIELIPQHLDVAHGAPAVITVQMVDSTLGLPIASLPPAFLGWAVGASFLGPLTNLEGVSDIMVSANDPKKDVASRALRHFDKRHGMARPAQPRTPAQLREVRVHRIPLSKHAPIPPADAGPRRARAGIFEPESVNFEKKSKKVLTRCPTDD